MLLWWVLVFGLPDKHFDLCASCAGSGAPEIFWLSVLSLSLSLKKIGPTNIIHTSCLCATMGTCGPPHIGCICYAHGVYEKNMGGISASEFSNLTPITQLRSHFRMGSTNLNLSIKVSCYVPHFKASPLWQQIFFWEGVWVQCPLSTKDSSRLICGWSASSQNQYRLCRKLLFEGADAAAGGWNVSSVRVECFKSFSFCKGKC